MQKTSIEKYFFFVLLLGTCVLSFFIFKPFILVIVLGGAFSLVLRPLFNLFNKHIKRNWLSALLTTALFAIFLFGPLFTLATLLVNEAQGVYINLLTNNFAIPQLQILQIKIQALLPQIGFIDFSSFGQNIAQTFSSNLGGLFATTLNVILSIGLIIAITFFFLKDGYFIKEMIMLFSPLSNEDNQKIITKMNKTVSGIVKGYLLVGLLQGLLLGVGMWIFGVPNPVLWGTFGAFFSMIPNIGTAIVSIPAIIYLFITGDTLHAVGFLIWAVVFVGFVDNIINPFFVGKNIEIQPLVFLFSVLGGIALWGPIGILLGPLVIAFLIVLIDIYKTEYIA